MEFEKMISEAMAAREKAYAPYSNFKVGAAVLTEGGKLFSGCNIENISFGATNCAERTAIFKAISEGNIKIKAIAIVGDLKEYTYPCGICRQVINEFASMDIQIIIAKNTKDYIVKTLEEILPGAFSKEALGR